MPIPQPKINEKQNDYMDRCMHKINKDNPEMENKQQVAICLNTYSNPKKKSKANEIEVDFSEDIKNRNKPQEIKVEEAPKIEAKIEEVNNTAVTAPAPEIKAQDNIVDIPDDQNTESLDGEKIQTAMLQMQHQYKILHWQTQSFSQHKSFDEIVSSLSSNIDEFIETYMGKYGRVIAAGTFNITLANYKDTDFMALTNNYIGFLIGLNDMLDKAQDSDLLNIRDEILGSLNQLKYLLTLV
jgi:flagellar basal body rod protein FlgB